MNIEELKTLPANQKLDILIDVLQLRVPQFENHIASIEKPGEVRAPKYDSRITRKGGKFQWCSETGLESLIYWHKIYATSAESDSKFADKDEKNATALSYWIKYRQLEPHTAWTGERKHETVTAKPPSYSPEQHDYVRDDGGYSGTGSYAKVKEAEFEDADYAAADDGDIPF